MRHPAAVRIFGLRQHAQQRRLAGTVEPYHTDAVGVVEPDRDVVSSVPAAPYAFETRSR